MNDIPRVAVRSVAGALLLMAFFTLVWAGWIFPAFSAGVAWPMATPFILLVLLFLVQGVLLFARSRSFPVVATAGRRRQTKRIGMRFGLIFGIEGALIGATSGILSGTGHDAYLAPAIALIVGAHFIPLARVFERTFDYGVAAWVIAVAIAGILLIALTSVAPALVSALVGIGTAMGTCAYGMYLLRAKRSILHAGLR